MDMKYMICFILAAVAVRTSFSDCVPPSGLGDASVTPSQTTYELWSRITLSCPEGYSPFGPEYSYCIDTDVWNPRPDEFRCMAQCKAPEVTSDVVHFPVGLDPEGSKTSYDEEEVIQYACADGEGATLIGPTEATCLNGAWQPAAIPTCNHCSPPRVSDTKTVRMTPDQGSYAAYAEVKLSCVDDTMYTAKGPNSTYCEKGGVWNPDPTKLTCHENCATPTHDPLIQSYPVHGTPEEAREMYGLNEVIRNRCIGGKTMVGPTIQRCVNGVWLPNIDVVCK